VGAWLDGGGRRCPRRRAGMVRATRGGQGEAVRRSARVGAGVYRGYVTRTAQHGRKSLLFLKKKKQKDFYLCACGKLRSMALQLGRGGKIKVFCFFSSEKKGFLSVLPSAAQVSPYAGQP